MRLFRAAHISGDLEQAVVTTPDGTWLYDLEGRQPAADHEITLFFAHALDIEEIEDADLAMLSEERLRDRMRSSIDRARALHGMLVGMDRDLSAPTKRAGILEAERLISKDTIKQFVERRFLRSSDAERFDSTAARTAATDAKAPAAAELYKIVAGSHLPLIESLIRTSNPGNPDEALDAAREDGLVADLARAMHSGEEKRLTAALDGNEVRGRRRLAPQVRQRIEQEFLLLHGALRPLDPYPRPNRRPDDVRDLLMEGRPGHHWASANRTLNRFFVVNLEWVIAELGVNHTTTGEYFQEARRVIAHETAWPQETPFIFECSKIQIAPKKRHDAKLFGHAATIVVAMEMAATHMKSNINIYDYLRIFDAGFYIEGFDLPTLERCSDSIPDFERNVTEHSGQFEKSLVRQMAQGFTVSRHVAESIVSFVEQHLPGIEIGSVRRAGDAEASVYHSAPRRGAAPALRVPRYRAPEELPRIGDARFRKQ